MSLRLLFQSCFAFTVCALATETYKGYIEVYERSLLAHFRGRDILPTSTEELFVTNRLARAQVQPELSAPFLDYFARFNVSTWTLLEFGSGESTVYWAQHFGQVVSYEDDKFWQIEVGKALKERGQTNVDLRMLDSSIVDEIKQGSTHSRRQVRRRGQMSALAAAVGDADMIIIDHHPNAVGRDTVAEYVLSLAESDQLIVLDNPEWNVNAWRLLEKSMLHIDFVGLRKRPHPSMLAAEQRAVAFNTGTSLYLEPAGLQKLNALPTKPFPLHWPEGTGWEEEKKHNALSNKHGHQNCTNHHSADGWCMPYASCHKFEPSSIDCQSFPFHGRCLGQMLLHKESRQWRCNACVAPCEAPQPTNPSDYVTWDRPDECSSNAFADIVKARVQNNWSQESAVRIVQMADPGSPSEFQAEVAKASHAPILLQSMQPRLNITGSEFHSFENLSASLTELLPEEVCQPFQKPKYDVRPFGDGSVTEGGILNSELSRAPERLGYVHPEYLGPRSESTGPLVWLSNAGSETALHRDPMDNFLCLLAGSKLFKLFPPEAHPFLYNTPMFSSDQFRLNYVGVAALLTFSLVDKHEYGSSIEKPNLDTFPLFSSVAHLQLEVSLQAGDCLFIPAGWFHKVSAKVPTFMVSTWQKTKPLALQGFPSIFYNETGHLVQGHVKATRHC